MTLAAYDSHGYLGDVATTHGWARALDALESGTPVLKLFAARGYTLDPAGFAQALLRDDPTLNNLAALADRAKDVLIITDGAAGDPEQAFYAQADDALRRELDALETQFGDALAGELRRVRAALAVELRTAKSPRAFKRLPRRAEVEVVVNEALERAWRAGDIVLRAELQHKYAQWDESKHPRHPAGDDRGGEWTDTEDSSTQSASGAKDQTQTPEFKRWFGDSKVVDAEGEPLVVYHGTNEDFSRFDLKKLGKNTIGNAGSPEWEQTSRVGHWFNSNPMGQSPEHYGAGYKVDMPVYLKLENPLILAESDDLAVMLHNKKGNLLRQELQVAGYDGIVIRRDIEFGGKSYIAFRPEQIKSATGNTGAFDPTNPDIRYSLPNQNEINYAISSFTPTAAVKWLAQAAFWITDILADDVLADAQRILVKGLKNGTAPSEMVRELWEAFVPYLGGSVGEEVISPFRLETIVRTNTTTAYNHGRLTAILDPEIARFVDGVQYSATLDERTTKVCQLLHGKVFLTPAGAKQYGGRDQTADLEALLPPRNFNCRSIIHAKVVGDPIDPADVITPDEIARAKELSGAGFAYD